MPDYSKGKIYTIRFNDDDNIYVGSSIQPLSVRFGEHKRKQKSPVYIHIFEKYNGDFKNCYIELYEEFPCESIEQLHKREGEIIRLIGTLNKFIAGRTRKEWEEDNKEILLEKKKEYYETHKEHLEEKKKDYRKKNKEHLEEKRKEYCENNKEIILKYHKEYRDKNKKIISEKTKIKIVCQCGCEVRKDSLKEHKQTKKHINLMSKLSDTVVNYNPN
jgi:hypothetical protein